MMSDELVLASIDENFNRHAWVIPSKTSGMKFFQQEKLSYVDSGLSCDTFNILHITDPTVSESELSKAVSYFKDKNLDFCIWVSSENQAGKTKLSLATLSLKEQNCEVGMTLDLANYKPIDHPQFDYIRVVTDHESLNDYATVIANHWNPADQHVISYYKETGDHYLDEQSRIVLCVYYHENVPVCTVEMFPTDNQIIGLYGLATLEKYRGHGIGTAMMAFALKKAKEANYQQVILQASEDGYGIYKKLGFEAHTTYYEFS